MNKFLYVSQKLPVVIALNEIAYIDYADIANCRVYLKHGVVIKCEVPMQRLTDAIITLETSEFIMNMVTAR